MDNSRVEVRVNFSAKEIFISGDHEAVESWMEKLKPIMDGFQGRTSTHERKINASPVTTTEAATSPAEVPEVFGAFLQEFRSDITDVDRILIAAAFIQSRSEDKSFTTGEANDLLKEQGHRLANPSMGVKRNILSKRAFAVTGGKFRVSSSGNDYLQTLRQQVTE